ncbi:MAG: hypothetical protein Ct9H300mP28_05620 [Pseudomonadota bacterium]|nr:MAG: hypothetical protein Ct9H300mP28_05620 [Pseudomonadota bacterium]
MIVSGSGVKGEHVKRAGKNFRARPGKQALLYELVSKDTGEYFTNQEEDSTVLTKDLLCFRTNVENTAKIF